MHHTMPTKGINFDKTEIAQVSSIENYEKGFRSIPSQSLAFSLQSYKVYINFRYLHMLATNTRRDAYTHQPRRIQPSFAQAAQSIYLSIYLWALLFLPQYFAINMESLSWQNKGFAFGVFSAKITANCFSWFALIYRRLKSTDVAVRNVLRW